VFDSIGNFIRDLLSMPAFGNWIALSALSVSLFSLIANRRATRISQQALLHAQSEADRAEKLEIERKRYELLCAISNEKSLLMAASLELGSMKADFDADTEMTKALMRDHAKIFGFLPRFDNVMNQLDQLYSVISAYAPADGAVELLRLSAEQHRISKDTEYAIKCCVDSIPTFKEKRKLAIQTQLKPLQSGNDA